MRIVASAMLLAISIPVLAAVTARDLGTELQVANKALAVKDYSTAYKQYARYAGHNPLAQFNLGLLEHEGWGRTPNPVAACHWFDLAAHKNIPAAQQFFGDCLAQGIGRAPDGPAAVEWYQKAAASGIVYALCSAGGLYITGKNIGRDTKRGLTLCTMAAQAESTPAMLRLADYYRQGTEVPRDLVAARYWYQQAAERHNHEAQYQLGTMLSEGQGGDANLPLALFWLERAATEGYAPAYLPVAILYANTRPDPATGALSPEILAKIYMWNEAAKAETTDPAKLAQISRIEQLVSSIMPPQWKPDLDRRVSEHLAKYNVDRLAHTPSSPSALTGNPP